MNLDHFGAAEYPYKTVLQNTTTESMATVLKNYGYKAHAIHDNSAAFYDRDLVFSQLGFDTFTTKESMNIKKWTENGWAKDQILTGCITVSYTHLFRAPVQIYHRNLSSVHLSLSC